MTMSETTSADPLDAREAPVERGMAANTGKMPADRWDGRSDAKSTTGIDQRDDC
jgi:hypothetical protein